jgi:chromosome segregation ATPase
MGSTADFISATLADTLLPFFRRPVEDVILETLDQRQIPNRTDFKELRDLVNSLRGQLGGATAGIKKVADTLEELEDRLQELDEQAARQASVEAMIDRKIQAMVEQAAQVAVERALAAHLAQQAASAPPAPAAPPATAAPRKPRAPRAPKTRG